jgi:hypothetical protein
MDAPRFDGLSRAVATGTSRRQLVRLLAGSALAGAGLVGIGVNVEAGGKTCCHKQRRRYRRAKRDCENRGGEFPQGFSCDRPTCDPDEHIAYLCLI